MPPTNRKYAIAISFLCGATVLCTLVLYSQMRAHESNRFAETSWAAGPKIPEVEGNWASVVVIDSDGKPIAGAKVNIENSSGDNPGTTDLQGIAYVGPLEDGTISGVDVNDLRVVNRQFAYYIGTPSVMYHIVFKVKLKKR